MQQQALVGIDGYPASSVTGKPIPDHQNSAIQDKLLRRVSELLEKAGVEIQGNGSLALDIDATGNIEVIGDVINRDEVTAALNGDKKLSALLQTGQPEEALVSGTAAWTQESYSVDISEEAISKARLSTEKNDAYYMPESQENTALAQQIGVVDKAKDSSPPESNIDNNKKVMQQEVMAVMGLGLSGVTPIKTQISIISGHIDDLRDKLDGMLRSILEKQDIELGDDEEFDIDIAKDGSISVKAVEENNKSRERAAEIQKALNADKESADGLSGAVYELSLFESALNEMSTGEEATISNGLAIAFIEFNLGCSIDEARDADGNLDTGISYLENLEKRAGSLFSGINASSTTKAADIDTAISLNKNGLSSDTKEENADAIQKRIADHITAKAYIYNDPSAYKDACAPESPDDEQSTAPGTLTPYLGYGEEGINAYEPAEEDRIHYFEATVDKDGKISMQSVRNALGKELGKALQRVAKEFFNSNQADIREYIAVMAQKTFEEHEYEHGDTDEFEHQIKITFDYTSSVPVKFEVISPDADKAAAKELQEVREDINEGINEYLQEEGVTTPVEIEINENGKLQASTETLTKAEADIVENTLEIINGAVDEVNYELAKAKEKDNGSGDESEDAESKEDEPKDEKPDSSTSIVGDMADEIARNLELKSGKDNTAKELLNNTLEERGSDLRLPGTGERILAGGRIIPQNMAENTSEEKEIIEMVKNKLPEGLQDVLDLTLGLKDIFAKFHENNNLTAALHM